MASVQTDVDPQDLPQLVEKYASACIALDRATDYSRPYAGQEADGIKAIDRKREAHAAISRILLRVLFSERPAASAPAIPAPVRRTVPQDVLDAEQAEDDAAERSKEWYNNGPPTAAEQAETAAARLALEMIQHQVARIERSSTCYDLVELCFNGLRYVHRGSWADTVSTIGEAKCRAALAKAKQEHGAV